MDFEKKLYDVFVRTNDQNLIVDVNSSAFLSNTTGWTEIDSGYGDRYRLAQRHYFDKPLVDERFVFRYRLEDGKPVERTQEEMDAEFAARIASPSDKERIAQLEEQLEAYAAAYAKGVYDA